MNSPSIGGGCTAIFSFSGLIMVTGDEYDNEKVISVQTQQEASLSPKNTNEKSLFGRMRREVVSFYETLKKENEVYFLVLLTSYMISFLMTKINWVEEIEETMANFRLVFFSLVLWGTAMYLFLVIVDWKKLWNHIPWLLLVGGALGAVTLYVGKITTRDDYTVFMGILFCLLAAGKNYRRIAKCAMYASFISLAVASVSVLIGYTAERLKPENVSPGHSFGIIYPNTWGYIAFIGIMACWYLYMQKRRLLTFIVFWLISAFMYFVISCRTIALMTAVFPFIALLCSLRKDNGVLREKKFSFAAFLLIALPFLFMALTALLCWQNEWVHKYFYNGPLHTMAMRFVQGGMAFRTYGVHLLGVPMESDSVIYYMLNGQIEKLYVMDNAFAICAITRGILWMAACLGWLGFAHWKAWKNRDRALLLVSFMMLVFSTMEHPGLDTWYNSVLLYPLAALGTPEKINWKFWEKKKAAPAAESIPVLEEQVSPAEESLPAPADDDEPALTGQETET